MSSYDIALRAQSRVASQVGEHVTQRKLDFHLSQVPHTSWWQRGRGLEYRQVVFPCISTLEKQGFSLNRRTDAEDTVTVAVQSK